MFIKCKVNRIKKVVVTCILTQKTFIRIILIGKQN